MWIRSQDGTTIIRTTNVYTNKDGTIYVDAEVSDFLMGEYASNAEAMEVLDMLQRQIEAVEYFKARSPHTDMPCPDFVFQMPPAGYREV